jgi:hypothetical protein
LRLAALRGQGIEGEKRLRPRRRGVVPRRGRLTPAAGRAAAARGRKPRVFRNTFASSFDELWSIGGP